MNRQEYIITLEKMALPRDQFIILSGGSLLLRGLRESTADFDLSMTKELAQKINLYDSPKDEKGFYKPYENVQALDDYDEKDYEIVDGFQCETLQSILEFKKRLNRPKDLKDIERIETILKKESV